MAPKESELKAVSKKKQFKLLVKKNRIRDLKLESLGKQQAKLLAKLNLVELYSPGEVKTTMDQLREVNRRLEKFNAWAKIYIETKLADPAWDAANIGN
ncbi:hypothetical protein CRYUN_Cryun38cG0013300 [Craigia yunnanensis]